VLHVPSTTAPDAAALAELLRHVALEAAERRPGADLVMRRLSDVFFVQVLRAWVEGQPIGGGGWLAAASDPRVGASLRAIHHNPRRDWKVADLAREAALSRSSFAARFAELSGETPMHYLARWRVLLAARALRDGTPTIGNVATSVGYSSVAAFARAFKRFMGESPGAYRRHATGSEL
jgi:transcriptional regulator GlxA family with amidase domain